MKRKYTANEAKELLKELKLNYEYVCELSERVREDELFAEGVGSSLRPKTGAPPSDNSKMTNGVAKLMKTEERLDEYIELYAARKAEALSAIHRIENPSERRVLLLYYFPKEPFCSNRSSCFRTWEEVAEKMKCDVRTAQRYHGSAIISFAKKISAKRG